MSDRNPALSPDTDTTRIAVINTTSIPRSIIASWVEATQKQIDQDVTPMWGKSTQLVLLDTATDQDYQFIKILDESDAHGTLGYHYLTPKKNAAGAVGIKTCERTGTPPSVTLSHEVLELMMNPALNYTILNPYNNRRYALEIADPVQSQPYDINLGHCTVSVSNFVYPSWYNTDPAAIGPFDHLKSTTRPFQLLPAGYCPIYNEGRWTSVFGSIEGKQKLEADGVRRGRLYAANASAQPFGASGEAIPPPIARYIETAYSPDFKQFGTTITEYLPFVIKYGPPIIQVITSLLRLGVTRQTVRDALARGDRAINDLLGLISWKPKTDPQEVTGD